MILLGHIENWEELGDFTLGIFLDKIFEIVKIRKKVPMEYSSEILSIIPPIAPADFCPSAIAKYQTPNMKAIILGGTNLLT